MASLETMKDSSQCSCAYIFLFSTINGFNCLTKWFPLNVKDPFSTINFLLFWLWFVIIFYNYFQAIFRGPGFVPKQWRPKMKQDEKYLQYCQICEGFKAPRAHHCKKCERCVLKLDHHCPWINTCIGHGNHAYFCWFLFYAILGCMHALLMISPCIYRVLFIPYSRWREEPIIHLTFPALISSILSIGLAIGVIIAVGLLLIIQLRNIVRNRSTIENWILSKASDRDHRRIEPFIYPYHLGWIENIRQICNWRDHFKLVGDGLTWPVRTGCDQYTFTREQLEQKLEKRQRAIRYKVIQSYNGSLFPFHYGFLTCMCIQYSKEARMPIKIDDIILVTHWERYWLYGSSIQPNKHLRGWFPRCCVCESFDIENVWWSRQSIKFNSGMPMSKQTN